MTSRHEQPIAEPGSPLIGCVIVAAGRGSRANLDSGPKQYHPLAGRPLIAWTVEALLATVPASRLCIVIHRDDRKLLEQSLGDALDPSMLVVDGGASRQASVLEGVHALALERPETTHVMIHDAARPFVSASLLRQIEAMTMAFPQDGVLPVLPIAETIKRVRDGAVAETVPRQSLQTAQTPQTFPVGSILEVHKKAAQATTHDFTDDASLFEWADLPVRAIPGDPANIKLTYAADFAHAERMLSMSDPSMPAFPDVRTGNGYDVHRFGPGNAVMLCGVAIPHDQALSGHSDADVGLHALTDALLATCGAGDIGDHFPPSDTQWKGAASSIFLEHAAQIVRDHGGTVMNADVTIVAEAPKIAPYREAMCEKLADLLGIARQRCSVKATTNETMGFVGRGEGIAALATASVVYSGRTNA